MRYFPIFFDLKDALVIVVGGGEEALRKIRLLLKTEARISVIAAELHDELKSNARVHWLATSFSIDLLKGAALVYSAEPELNVAVSDAAKALGIPVNAVDQAEISSFIVPSIVDRDPVVIAIGTEGTAPVLGQGLRAKIDALLPQRLGLLAARAASLRARVAAAVPHGHARRSFWQEFFFGPAREALMEGDDVAFALAVNDTIYEHNKAPTGSISFVGAGPGDAELLTLKAQRKLYEADIIIYDRGTPKEILEMARRDAVRIQAVLNSNELELFLAQHARNGKRVVRLLAGSEQNQQGELEQANLQCQGFATEFVPGLSRAVETLDNSPFPINQAIQDAILRSAT
jgi:uroporphyrin-III C-methyltransferase / precorrin-2 dehydrogenase / sirohydrochlorin ferrochelatase